MATIYDDKKKNSIYGDVGGAANAQQFQGQGVGGTGDYVYNNQLNTSQLSANNYAYGTAALAQEKLTPGYLENRNNNIANALYNEGKTDAQSVRNYLNTSDDFRTYDPVGQNNTITAILNRMGTMGGATNNSNLNGNGATNNNGTINNAGGNINGSNSPTTNGTNGQNSGYSNGTLMNNIINASNKAMQGDSNLMGGGITGDYWSTVENKLKTAYGINSLEEFKQRYPEQYESTLQALQNVEGVRNATDPNSRQLLDGQLQGIIGTGVGAGSDTSKLKVLESSIMNKFENPDQVKQDAQNVVKLQTEGKSIPEIAQQMGISEDQVEQLVLLHNGLDSKAGQYYKLKSNVASDITEPYDTKMNRNDIEKDIALERANRQLERLTEDFNTAIERQTKVNEINAHNADFLAGQFGYGFSKRGIEGLNYVADQAKQIIDDITKNYDRNSQQIADQISDIIRQRQRNNEDLEKASEDALTNAKNNYTSNMLSIQQQYGTVGLQAQQYLSQNVQSFITTAENIYSNALTRQQQNLSNLITNVSNVNAIAAQNLTLRQNKIAQFQSESMNLNRNQLQSLADQLGMDSNSYQDLVNYQVQGVANELNGYIPGSGAQFQSSITQLLNQGYTPNEALGAIMNSAEFKSMAASGDNGTWQSAGNGMIYNNKTGEFRNPDGGVISGGNTLSSQTVNGKTYAVSEENYNKLLSFEDQYQIGTKGGQCGAFVNKYLQSLGIGKVFTDPIKDKVAAINTEEGYTGQVGDVIVMDSPTQPKYGHVAIITGIDGNGNYITLESNRKDNDEIVFSRTIDPKKQKVYGFYHPGGESVGGTSKNTSAYEMADAILNGVGSLPAKNSKEYSDTVVALNDRVKQLWGTEYPEGIALINYSVINDNNLSDALSTSISSTMQSIYSTDMLMDLLEENNPKTGPIVSKIAKMNPRDADYAAIAASINQMSSNIARGFGEKGVLTDADIERYMKTIPNEKMGENAREVVGTLLKAKLYDGLVRTLEAQAKNKKDVSMYAYEYQEAIDWLSKNGFRTGSGRGLTGGGLDLTGRGRS